MFVHIFLENNENQVFKKIVQATDLPPRNANLETLYGHKDGVGFFITLQMYKFIPIHRVKEIQFTRKAGEQWV